jgi:hypothetical protein
MLCVYSDFLFLLDFAVSLVNLSLGVIFIILSPMSLNVFNISQFSKILFGEKIH